MDLSRLASTLWEHALILWGYQGLQCGRKRRRKDSVGIAKTLAVHRRQVCSTQTIYSIRGTLRYMESQAFGRTFRLALSVLTYIAEDSKPRRISQEQNGPSLILFTAGACEGYSEDGVIITSCSSALLDIRDHRPWLRNNHQQQHPARRFSSICGTSEFKACENIIRTHMGERPTSVS